MQFLSSLLFLSLLLQSHGVQKNRLDSSKEISASILGTSLERIRRETNKCPSSVLSHDLVRINELKWDYFHETHMCHSLGENAKKNLLELHSHNIPNIIPVVDQTPSTVLMTPFLAFNLDSIFGSPWGKNLISRNDIVLKIVRNILVTVEKFHSHRFFHLFIRPSSVLIDSAFQVFFTNFGYGKFIPKEQFPFLSPGYIPVAQLPYTEEALVNHIENNIHANGKIVDMMGVIEVLSFLSSKSSHDAMEKIHEILRVLNPPAMESVTIDFTAAIALAERYFKEYEEKRDVFTDIEKLQEKLPIIPFNERKMLPKFPKIPIGDGEQSVLVDISIAEYQEMSSSSI